MPRQSRILTLAGDDSLAIRYDFPEFILVHCHGKE